MLVVPPLPEGAGSTATAYVREVLAAPASHLHADSIATQRSNACYSPRPGVYWRRTQQRTEFRKERLLCDTMSLSLAQDRLGVCSPLACRRTHTDRCSCSRLGRITRISSISPMTSN